MTRQMILDLPVRPALGRDDFFVSPSNLTALAMVDAPQRWPGGKLLLLGPAGSGKSHLAEVFAHDRGAAIVPAAELFEMPVPPGILVIEDAEQAAGRAEELLFHIHNAVLAMDGLLLLTAARPPGDWGLRLPDLLSRMQATTIVRLDPPDDALLAAVLVKMFADRQLRVPQGLIPWLVTRMERSFDAARALVAALDARALALGRPITRAMAAELLDSRLPETR